MTTYLLHTIIVFLQLYSFILFLRVILSWFPIPQKSTIYQLLQDITDPLLKPMQRLIPPIGGVDFSPIALFFLFSIVISLLESYLPI